MIRNLKILGLAVTASVAMSAIAAWNASATGPYWLNLGGDWTVLSGSQNNASPDTRGFSAGTLTCTTTTYSGSTSATTTTTFKLAPTYGGCTLKPLPGTATIHMNGCEYEFHTDGYTTNGAFDTETTINCPTTTSPSHVTHDITITVVLGGITKCTIHIEEQNLGTGLVLTNEGADPNKDFKVHISFSHIKYTQTQGTGEGKCETTTTTFNSTWTGSATFQGKTTGGAATSISAA